MTGPTEPTQPTVPRQPTAPAPPAQSRPAGQGERAGEAYRIAWTIFLVCFVLLATIVGLVVLSRTQVPDVLGRRVEDAKELIRDAGLKPTVSYRADAASKGTVLEQTPPAGYLVARGSRVRLVASLGQVPAQSALDQVEVPNLVGVLREEAAQRLSTLGLTSTFTDEFSSNQTGTVISQFPTSGQLVPLGAQVLRVVSKGSSTTTSTAWGTGLVVVIDPGRQQTPNMGKEPIGPGSSKKAYKCAAGYVGVSSKTPEYKINLAISQKLRDLLVTAGAKVVMTRIKDDIDLSSVGRAEVANKVNADLFVRVFCNGSSDSGVAGVNTVYPSKDDKWTHAVYSRSYAAAQAIQTEVVAATGRANRGTTGKSNVVGFNWSKVPSIMLQAGYLSNSEEDALLNSSSFQAKVADGLAAGIRKYWEAHRQ